MKEDELHKLINQYLMIYQQQHPNLLFYTYMPFGEKRNPITGALLKAKGTKKGVPDFFLLFKNKVDKKKSIIIWIECKVGKNKQSLEQIEFERIINELDDEYYYCIYSLDELIKLLSFNKF